LRGFRPKLSLSTQFIVAAAVVLCLSMAVLGTWVNRQITRSVLTTSGLDALALIQAFIEPEVQDARADGALPARSHLALDALFVGAPIGRRIVSVKIWRPDGSVVYSSMSKDVIGQSFASTDVAKAASGELVSEFEDMVSSESAYEQSLRIPLIEVYAPLYRTGTGELLAVGEIYQDGEALATQLRVSRRRTWAVVCLTTLVMLAVLYAIVRRGSHTIATQRAELQHRISEVQEMASQNEALRIVAERTRLDANEANEELIGRIGLDIHDGPIQQLSLLMLRIGALRPPPGKGNEKAEKTWAAIRELATSVIQELRTLSTGLVLPEIGDLTVAQTIELAAERHENLTGTRVEVSLGRLPAMLPVAMKICLYRIVQESLSNSFRHAGGEGQQVGAALSGGQIAVSISDKGGGMKANAVSGMGTKLGLRGIRNRAQAFGGVAEIRSSGLGTTVVVRLPVDGAVGRDGL
jgi:signal transduction histidine kinase